MSNEISLVVPIYELGISWTLNRDICELDECFLLWYMWIIGIVHTVYSYWQIQHAIAGELLENGSFRDYRRKSEINKVKSQV